MILINYGHNHKYNANEIVLEFTSKILAGCGISDMIDKDNFLRVFEIIKPIVEFKEDFNPKEDFSVLKCNVTQDMIGQIKTVKPVNPSIWMN